MVLACCLQRFKKVKKDLSMPSAGIASVTSEEPKPFSSELKPVSIELKPAKKILNPYPEF